MTGGHADVHTLHKPWFDDACANGMPMQLADGVPECLKAVRMQLRAGANVIKICGSGGVGSERDNPVDQQFSEEEMKAMVDEAARAQRIIGAHCHNKPGIMAALRSGVKTIEHGSYIDEEAADLMLEKGAILVATRLIVANGLALGEQYFAPYAWAKLKALADSHWKAMQIAIRKGVKIAIGTDTTGTTPGSKLLRFDRVGKELYYHVKAGMSPLQTIEAATANGPLTLGPQAPKAGILKEGYDADFIALDENPLDDISVLTGPDHVTHVWKGGKLYKSPGHLVSIL
jgi:imidazolonepropionase-like amidohydrolase